MSKHYLYGEYIDMGKYQDIVERAIDNYGIVTSAEATAMGVALKDICEWVSNGRLEKVGRGVYRLSQFPMNELCHYAEAVALVGKGSWIWGESVLAMHDLALVNPLYTFVATTKRVRRNLPKWIKVVKVDSDADRDSFDGIPCQNIASVFIEAKGRIMFERLVQAVKEARNRGLLAVDENARIKKELKI